MGFEYHRLLKKKNFCTPDVIANLDVKVLSSPVISGNAGIDGGAVAIAPKQTGSCDKILFQISKRLIVSLLSH